MTRLLIAVVTLTLSLAGASHRVLSQTSPPVLDDRDTRIDSGRRDTRVTVPVMLQGRGPYPFVLDTGAQRTVISRDLATVLGLRAGPVTRVIAISRTRQVATAIIPTLRIDGIGDTRMIHAPVFESRDLGAVGLLGIDALANMTLRMDFEQDMVFVRAARRGIQKFPDQDRAIVMQARKRSGQLILTDAYIDGRRIHVVVDTGTPISLGNAALRRLVDNRGLENGTVEITDVTGGQVTANYVRVGRVQIGGITFKRLPVAFVTVAPFTQFGLEEEPALLLGMDAIQLFRAVEFDFVNREIRFQPYRKGSATSGIATRFESSD